MVSTRNIKYQLAFMWLFVLGIYLPFYIFMLNKQVVSTTSLSVIGWYLGGMEYLVLYLIITLPFSIYLMFFFNRHFAGNNKLVKIMTVGSCLLIAIGAFIPLRHGAIVMNFAHTFISIASSIVLMLTVLFALILYALNKKHKKIFLSLYGIYAATLLIAFYILSTATLYQLSATLSFFIVLLFISTVEARNGELLG